MRSDIVSDVLGIISTNLLIAEVLIYSPNYQDIIKRNNFIAVVSAPFIFFHLQFFKNSLMSIEPFLVFALDLIGWIGSQSHPLLFLSRLWRTDTFINQRKWNRVR